MIVKYSHKEIDREKYTICLHTSENYRVYAELWYLDIVSATSFDVLVLNDYEAVMPIPYQKKIGLKFVIQPILCQQLGIFYQKKISSDNFNLFFSYLKNNRVRSYNFNEENLELSHSNEPRKNNQILALNNPYEITHNNFERDKKKSLKRKTILDLIISETFAICDFDNLYNQNHFPYFSSTQISTVRELLIHGHQRNKITQYTIQNSLGLKSVFLWTLISKNRIIILISARIKELEEKGAFVFLIDHLIRKYSNTHKIIDFEGSMIPGVAKFNQSLGAITQQYISYKNFKWFELLK